MFNTHSADREINKYLKRRKKKISEGVPKILLYNRVLRMIKKIFALRQNTHSMHHFLHPNIQQIG